jgi:L-threonylcarbamoyladenylate synthase
MVVRVLPVDPASPRDDKLAQAVAVVAGGGVVALPTETFYGLAADAFAALALARVNALKGKSSDSPILLLLADRRQAGQVVQSPPALFERLAERFWPGPLTMVVPAAPGVPHEVTGGGSTVAVRVPGLALPRRLAAGLGRPISGVSANPTGQPPLRTASDVAQLFTDGLEMILDGGPAPGGAPSTILDLSTATPRLLREGLIPLSALRPFLGPEQSGLR